MSREVNWKISVHFEHRIRVRYGDCDMQRVVFNANYLAYCDDAVDVWVRTALGGNLEDFDFDFMLKKMELTWHRGARFADEVTLRIGITRWGNTSFDVTINGLVGSEACFDAAVVYVSTTPGAATSTPIPTFVREKLQPYFN